MLRIESLAEEEKRAVDLHGMTAEQAELCLIDFLEALPKTVRAVQVTHGYSHGTRLKWLVKEEFYHWRVAEKRPCLNPGATWYIMK